MITDYTLLFIDDYSKPEELERLIIPHRWQRAYSRGILETIEHRVGRDDLVFLDLETGDNMKDDPKEISSRVSKERFYVSVKDPADRKKAGRRAKKWNASGYRTRPIEHKDVVKILENISSE
ncbi:hypothetical protein HYV89_05515 [Candidatus Woesearchaeota archaeon]|nr:hypothetical protein [Candidatus Woesearchaeota archaeon]